MRRNLYVLLALLGLVGAAVQNTRHFMQDDGNGLWDFATDAFATPASASATLDLLVVALAALVFMIVEARRVGVRHVWIFIVLSMTVALAVGFPLFLAAREHALDRRRVSAPAG